MTGFEALEYDALNVTTQTFRVYCRLDISNEEFFDLVRDSYLCEPLVPIHHRKNMQIVDKNADLPDGSVLYAEHGERYCGCTQLRKRRPLSAVTTRKSLTLILKYGTRFFNVKISNKGNFHITGCKNETQVVELSKTIRNMVHKTACNSMYIFPVMCNATFSLGFKIHKHRLTDIVNQRTSHVSLIEHGQGHVGLSIKIKECVEELPSIPIVRLAIEEGEWRITRVPYKQYLDVLAAREVHKKMLKGSPSTFLVFYSGKCIMSGGISYANRVHAFNEFKRIILTYKDEIQSQ